MKKNSSQQDREIIKLLEGLKTVKANYPLDLMTNRRAVLVSQLELLKKKQVMGSLPLEKEALIDLLKGLEQVRASYPPMIMAKQRAAFLQQAARHRKASWLESLRFFIQNRLIFGSKVPTAPPTFQIRGSLIVLTILVTAFAGLLLFGNQDRSADIILSTPTQQEYIQPILVVPTATIEINQTTCAPGSSLQPCTTYGFTKSPDQASWISSDVTGSWIKIDTGQTAIINKLELDRISLGDSKADFTISVAQTDNHYQQIYDSKSGVSVLPINGQETIQVFIEPVAARFVKVEVANPGMVINEVRAYSANQPLTPNQIVEATKTASLTILDPSRTPLPIRTPLSTKTPMPTNSPTITSTSSATITPSPSSTPSSTVTSSPNNTPYSTATSSPNNTPYSTASPTSTQTPKPTNTPSPANTLTPTDTLIPTNTVLPTSTSTPASTQSSLAP